MSIFSERDWWDFHDAVSALEFPPEPLSDPLWASENERREQDDAAWEQWFNMDLTELQNDDKL